MPVCPECGDAHLEQAADKWYFQCAGGHRFRLVKADVVFGCPDCGKVFNPYSNRVGWNAVKCPQCGKIFNYDY